MPTELRSPSPFRDVKVKALKQQVFVFRLTEDLFMPHVG